MRAFGRSTPTRTARSATGAVLWSFVVNGTTASRFPPPLDRLDDFIRCGDAQRGRHGDDGLGPVRTDQVEERFARSRVPGQRLAKALEPSRPTRRDRC